MRQLTGGKRDTIYTPAVLMLVIIVGISFLGLGLVMPLRALYGRQIGASSTEIGLMTASFLLAGFLASPPVGWLADRFGYKTDLHLVFLSSLGDLPALLPVLSCYYLDWHGNSILLTKKCQMWRNLLLPKSHLKRRLSSDERYFRQG